MAKDVRLKAILKAMLARSVRGAVAWAYIPFARKDTGLDLGQGLKVVVQESNQEVAGGL